MAQRVHFLMRLASWVSLTLGAAARMHSRAADAEHWANVLQDPDVRRECPELRSLPKLLHLKRWPALNQSRIGVTRQWAWWMQNVETVEPLAMASFISAIKARQQHANSSVIIDIGANMGMYALVGASIAPSFTTIAVDMQPRCVQVTRCHLALNGLLGRSVVFNNFVSSNASAAPILVPSRVCDSMASPTAVGGRRPDGSLRSNSNAILKGRFNHSLMRRVQPLVLGSLLQRRLTPGERIAVVKIDTEGFEPLVLESLRPLWPLVDALVIELQPNAWKLHGIDVEVAIATLRELVEANGFRAISLPHPRWKEMSPNVPAASGLVDLCRLPARAKPLDKLGWLPHVTGLHKAEIYEASGLASMLREALRQPPGSFYEVLLSKSRRCDAAG